MENQLYRTIELYLRRQMPPDERRAFKAKIATDPELAAEVSFYEALLLPHDEQVKSKWRTQDESLLQPETQAPPLLFILRPQWAVAASLALLLAAGVWYTFIYSPPLNSDTVFQENYEGYKYSGILGAGSSAPEDSVWQTTLSAYRAGRFEEAIRTAGQLSNSAKYAAEAELLTGAAYLENGQIEEAIRAFAQVDAPPALRRKAQFFTAMAHLKAKNTGQAKTLFNTIATDEDSPYRGKADTILGEL